ncbi:MAG: hypothetical protein KHX11_10960 [Bacteroides cellulosilyticus]|jgi:hypothetical protein|nr:MULTISPECIES: hypothetical protein [Bacteroides]KAA5419048.1 hypothetical protein F2Y87_11950 [Bacteroides cellulosilyticus]MBS5699552.1 hypothetical protein [Bacteroides cellulosilyticus]MDT4512870.1 hypothetical protein [Bacteroides cellulosilyticus]MDV7046974.1 hypothetical protein [Bacteroides cellulosilyticus]
MAMADGILTENEKELFRSYFQLTDKEAEDLFQSIEAELECVQSETEVINWKRKNGIDFEKCIVKMLNPQYYTLQEWTGDKFIDGRFCEANCNPDITVKVNLDKLDVKFAIECKWRMNFFNGYTRIATEQQLNHYRRFQEERNITVFFALGVGGTGEQPQDIYLFPLNKIKYPILREDYIAKYLKKGRDLYFDVKTQKLT